MTESFRRTLRAFLDGERPASRNEALALLNEWFSRYDPDPRMLAEEVERHFRTVAGRKPGGRGTRLFGLVKG